MSKLSIPKLSISENTCQLMFFSRIASLTNVVRVPAGTVSTGIIPVLRRHVESGRIVSWQFEGRGPLISSTSQVSGGKAPLRIARSSLESLAVWKESPWKREFTSDGCKLEAVTFITESP